MEWNSGMNNFRGWEGGGGGGQTHTMMSVSQRIFE